MGNSHLANELVHVLGLDVHDDVRGAAGFQVLYRVRPLGHLGA